MRLSDLSADVRGAKFPILFGAEMSRDLFASERTACMARRMRSCVAKSAVFPRNWASFRPVAVAGCGFWATFYACAAICGLFSKWCFYACVTLRAV